MREQDLHEYQRVAVQHILDHPAAGLFLDMGLGKTVSTLTALNRLMFEDFEIGKALVIAPKRVAEDTWTTECEKWDHLRHLRVSKVLGTVKQRKNALQAPADVYVTNRENVVWLVSQFGAAWPFDTVVIDELSSFKSHQAVRFKALRSVRPMIRRVIGLTGTPAPNGLIDLWSQIYLLDQGERLGKTITGYRERFFRPGRSNGRVVFSYDLRDGSDEFIYRQIGDICLSMQAEDYLQLPERINITVPVRLSAEERGRYETFERDHLLAIEDLDDITAVNASALSNKLLQYANGAVYDGDKVYHEVHRAKLEALGEIVEAAQGQPVLVFYSYKSDLDRIRKYLRAYKPRTLDTPDDIRAWNAGEIPVLLAHPASVGHGLNLQAGGHIAVWFGLTWALELYQQANARLHRQGQTRLVTVYHLAIPNTMDEEVLKSLDGKQGTQDAIKKALKARAMYQKSVIKRHHKNIIT